MANENFRQAVIEYGGKFVEETIRQLILNDKKATGDLIDSLDYRVIEAANEITLEILANDYLYNVDKGRNKGTWPNVWAIQKWVAVRGITPYSGKRVLTTNQIGWAIAKSIKNGTKDSKYGIEPTNVLKKAKATFFSNKANIQPIIDGAVIDMKDLIKQAIKNLNN